MIRKIINNISLFLNLLAAILLLLCYIAQYINPAKYWLFGYFSLLFPFVLILNIFFIIFWIIKGKKYFIISLLLFLLSFKLWISFYKVPFTMFKKNEDKRMSYKVLSFNVRGFNVYNWIESKSVSKRIFDYIEEENADIICMQEAAIIESKNLGYAELLKRVYATPYHHMYSGAGVGNKGDRFAIAIFSRYKIINRGTLTLEKTNNLSIYADIVMRKDTVRVYNLHLQSLKFIKEDYDVIDTVKLKYTPKEITTLLQMHRKIKHAFRLRGSQSQIISKHISKSPYKVIVCGDFNDTPSSYTYYKVKGNLYDAFLISGSGFGYTYAGSYPSFRIDYIMHSKNIHSFGFKVDQVPLSDHYPISCRFYFNEADRKK